MNNTQFLNYARIFAIYWVVLIQHNFAPFSQAWSWIGNGENFPFQSITVYTHYITIISMPLCFFISGYIYRLSPPNRLTIKTFTQKKINRLLIPCLVFSILFELLQTGHITVRSMVGYQHLWFIWHLFMMFLISCTLLQHSKNSSIISLIIVLLAFKYISTILDFGLGITFTTYYVWFLLGCIYQQKGQILTNKQYNMIWIGIFATYIYVNQKFQNENNSIIQFLYILISIIAFLRCLNKFIPNLSNNKTFRFINKTSYGVYIFHMIYLYIFYLILKQFISEPIIIDNSYWLTTSLAILTVPFSIGTTLLINKTKILKL